MGLALGLSALAITPLVVTGIERLQARATADLLPHDGMAPGSAQRSAVIFFSRSGNTALLARHLARRLNAGLYRLEARDYSLGLLGWANALRDAQNHEANISVPEIDLSAHNTIYLGSPIWMFSPAPPLWQFVVSQRFDGKQVVLVNTFNSRFKPEFIEQFRQLVMQRGALSFEHRFVRRGRMGWQLSPQEMLDSFDARWSA
jgi:hypothetical protein|uniref:flavodoxin family protein n=1 Tax=uncultured Acidovorax sp. TaxID=158751 RepID=UPI00076A814A|nr:hypothetical protein [uncultured Acidovorax sp.]